MCMHVQVIIGSYPHGDGTFDKANDFQSVVVDGAWTMGSGTAKLHAGQVAYIVPAAKGVSSIWHFQQHAGARIIE